MEDDSGGFKPRGIQNPADQALVKLAPEMASMLRELEWSGGDVSGAGCPECDECHPNREREEAKRQHKPDCRLAALLRELP